VLLHRVSPFKAGSFDFVSSTGLSACRIKNSPFSLLATMALLILKGHFRVRSTSTRHLSTLALPSPLAAHTLGESLNLSIQHFQIRDCEVRHWMRRRRNRSVGEGWGATADAAFRGCPIRRCGEKPSHRVRLNPFPPHLLPPGEDRAKIGRRQKATGSGVRADCGASLGTCFLIPKFLNSPSFLRLLLSHLPSHLS